MDLEICAGACSVVQIPAGLAHLLFAGERIEPAGLAAAIWPASACPRKGTSRRELA
jgi:hypothetical protein